MACAPWSLLLAVLLFGSPVAAVSPLDPVNLELIVTNLGSYFEELANSALSVDTAEDQYNALTGAERQFSIDDLVSAVDLDTVVEEISDISDKVLQEIQTVSRQDTELGTCCNPTGSDPAPCCYRCSEYPLLDREATNAGFSLSTEAGNAQGTTAKASFQFGFSSGPLVQYPPPTAPCAVTDSRLQQWYSFAASEPRTVVVLLDISFDLDQSDGTALRNAAIDLLRSLNSKDQVSLVAYSSATKSPPSCYQFITATAENVDYLVSYVTSLDDLQAPSALDTVLDTAVASVNETELILSGRTGMVAVFSGPFRDFNLLVPIVTGNPELNFKFIFPNITVLPGLLQQGNAQSFFLFEDAFAPIASFIDLRNTSSSQLEWTASFDPVTGDKSINFVRLLSTGANFHGVFHAEISVTDLFDAALRHIDTKPLSYLFVTDNSAERQPIYHPLSLGNNIIQSIFEVERDIRPLFQDTSDVDSIDNVTVFSTVVLPLGPSDEEGILTDTHDYTYSCRIALNISGFSNQLVLCVALRSGADVEVDLTSPTSQLNNLAYHTQLPQDTSCSYLAHLANTDSALRLYGASQPAVGVSDSDLNAYLTTGGDEPEGIQQGVRADSNTVSSLTTAWATNAYAEITTWRYFFSDRGLFAVFPGIELPDNYQPVESTWYRSALPHTDIALSPVERDPLGGGFVYGISRRVVSSTAPQGVVGAHFAAGSLVVKLEEIAPECYLDDHICYIFDSSGSIVYWSDLRASPPTTVQSLVEVTSSDPYLSHVLNEATDFRLRQNCIDYSSRNIGDRHYFQYVRSDQEVSNTNATRCVHYRIRGIPGTNAIFAIAARTVHPACSPLCPCTNTCSRSQCPSYEALASQQSCVCRCSCPEDLSGDSDQICMKKSQSLPICPPLRMTPSKFQPVTTDVTSSACLSTQDCPSLGSASSCQNTSSCLYCVSSCQSFTSCCDVSHRDGFAVCDHPTLPTVVSNPANIVAIVVPVVLIVLLIVIIFVGLMIWYNIRIKGKEDPVRRKHRGAFDFSKDKSLDEDASAAKIKEVNADQEANLAVSAPTELGDSAENGDKPEITDTAV